MMMLRSRTTKAVKTVGCDSACGKLVFFCTPFSALARFQSQRVTASRRDWHRSSGAARGSALHDLQGRVPAPAEGPTAGSHGVAPDTLPPRCACDSMLHRHCQNGPPTSGPGRGRSSSHSRRGALGTDADEVRSSRRAPAFHRPRQQRQLHGLGWQRADRIAGDGGQPPFILLTSLRPEEGASG